LNQGARFKPPPSHIVAERVIPLQSPGVRCWDTQRLLECKRLKSCIKDITTLFATPSINYDPSSAPLAIISLDHTHFLGVSRGCYLTEVGASLYP
jgi:hypothetical protein